MNSNFFLSCDWGTTHFRLRLVDKRTAAIVDEIKTPDGAARMAEGCSGENRESRYAQHLASNAEALISKHRVEVGLCVVSGMASSRIGWRELPYAALPQPLDGSGLVCAPLVVPLTGLPALDVLLVSGVRSEENVMRGEEIELVGLAQRLPPLAQEANATLVMPGTHSKHVKLSRGMILDFDTFMTGELFGHLQSVPTLRDCLRSSESFDGKNPWYVRGVREAASGGFLKSIFKIRSRTLLAGTSPTDGVAYLSGLLIGTELLQLSVDPGHRVFIAAGGSLGALYGSALAELGIANAEFIDGDMMAAAIVCGHLQMLKNVA